MFIRTLLQALLIATAFVPTGPTTTTTSEKVTNRTPPASAKTDPFGIYGADEQTELMIEEANALFQAAGLSLPALRIYVHDNDEPCNGNQGLFSKTGDQHRVDICTHHINLIIHELAHAWEYHNVDETTRQKFMEQAQADGWNDHNVVHQARGVEIAADIIKWGLADGQLPQMSASHYAQQLAQYELLTGTQTPRIAHWNQLVEQSGSANVAP